MVECSADKGQFLEFEGQGKEKASVFNIRVMCLHTKITISIPHEMQYKGTIWELHHSEYISVMWAGG